MPRIRVLSDDLVNRIAAGEVVERPASVVKELVENSLDAEAGRIEIELVNGGRSLIRVSDDGHGMDADDAVLALERHATSKIDRAEQLDHITTLGFRGEALPSIAAVSRFSLVTCADPAEGGARVTVEGGRILGVDGAARARGTTVEVNDLFFNVPARRKFLRSPETELRHAQELVWGCALARPDVAFSLRHGGRTLIDAPAAADAARRLRDLWRKADRVVAFQAAAGEAEVHGLLAPGPGRGRPSLTLLVNGRAVRDRLVVGAVMRVLRSAGSGFGGARIVVDLRLPAGEVDVNVHPAKTEVRFVRSGSIFSLIERAVRSGVASSQGQVEVRSLQEQPQAEPPGSGSASGYGELARGRHEAVSSGGLFSHPAYGQAALDDPADPSADRRAWVPTATAHRKERSGARAGVPDTPFGRLIGQYRDSFLLLEDEMGLAIVDQHVAHERVLFDQIKRRLAGAEAPSQRLLSPHLLEVEEARAAALPGVASLLEKVGIEADLFGPDTIRISSVPPELDAEDVTEVVEELLDRATALDASPDDAPREIEEGLAASLSCRGAVKINHHLTEDEQRALLVDLVATDNPYRCPHGRPIILRLSQEEMERRLGRR